MDEYEYNILGKHFSLPLIDTSNHTKECILLNATILFATRGYASVSMRDLADITGIKPASLYNHFSSKEVLWKEALKHAKGLYLLYFDHLDGAIAKARTFEEVLDVIFLEPKKMANLFTCYAFCMIQSEQFRDSDAGDVFNETILKYSMEFMQKRFEQCIEKGMVEPFDTKTVARIIMNSVLIGLGITVQKCIGRTVDCEPSEMFAELQQFILQAVKRPQV